MTQPFTPTYKRAETPVNTPAGTKLYLPLQDPILPSYVPPLDYTTVTSVTIAVTRQYDGSKTTWTTTSFTSITTAGLVAVYSFAVNDTPVPGVYFLRAAATAPVGTAEFDVVSLYVLQP